MFRQDINLSGISVIRVNMAIANSYAPLPLTRQRGYIYSEGAVWPGLRMSRPVYAYVRHIPRG